MSGNAPTGTILLTGCRTDIEHLLELFTETNSLRYAPFFEIFQRLHFHTIYWGKLTLAELVEFSEKVLQIAIGYAMPHKAQQDETQQQYKEEFPKEECLIASRTQASAYERSLQERLFGVYLTYSLYVTQPYRSATQVRVTMQQIHDLRVFLTEQLLPERHHDAVSILLYLARQHVFRIVHSAKDHDVLLNRRQDHYTLLEEGAARGERAKRDPFAILSAIQTEPLFSQVETMHKWYSQMKTDAGLGHLNMVKSMTAMCTDIIQSAQRNDGDLSADPQRNYRRSELKARAFKAHTESARLKRLRRLKSETEQQEVEPVAGPSGLGDHSRSAEVNTRDLKSRTEEDSKKEEGADGGTAKRKRRASTSSVDKLFELPDTNVEDKPSTSKKAKPALKKTKSSGNVNEDNQFVMLSLGGSETKTRLPEQAIKVAASVSVSRSKAERKSDAILKKLSATRETSQPSE